MLKNFCREFCDFFYERLNKWKFYWSAVDFFVYFRVVYKEKIVYKAITELEWFMIYTINSRIDLNNASFSVFLCIFLLEGLWLLIWLVLVIDFGKGSRPVGKEIVHILIHVDFVMKNILQFCVSGKNSIRIVHNFFRSSTIFRWNECF